jgi:protein RecA
MALKLENIVKEIKKEMKVHTLKLGSDYTDPTDFVSSGNLALDWCLEDDGFSFKFIIQLLGKSKSGKTALMLKALANAQDRYNAYGIWADREGAFVRSFAEKLGVDMSRLLLMGPHDIPTPQNAFSFFVSAHELIRQKEEDAYIVVCLDSAAAFLPTEDIDGGEDMGRTAKSLHRGFRKIASVIDERSMMFFSNQIQANVGVLFGKKEIAAGGGAPKYYSSYILELDEGKLIKDDAGIVTGQNIKAEVVKTRLGASHRGIIIPFEYETGFDYYGGFFRMLVAKGIMSPTNKKEFMAGRKTHYKHTETEKKYHEDDVEQLLKDHPELAENKASVVYHPEEE